MIPEDWLVSSVRQIADTVRGGSPRPAGDPRFSNGSFIPWLTVAALTNLPAAVLQVTETASYLTKEGSFHSRTLDPGTVIIANSGATLGVAKVLGIKCCANDGIAALLNLSKRVCPAYLTHYINTVTDYLRKVVATGNGQPNLNTDLIGRLTFPLPPSITEQELIASALNDANALVESLGRLIAKMRVTKRAAMQELLSGKRRLQGFSGQWSERSLGELGTWRGGMTPSMQNPGFWEMGNIPWISSGDVKSQLLTETGSSVTEAAVKQGKTALLPAQCIVVVTRSGILRKYLPVAMNMVSMAINQDIKALIPHASYDPFYLLHMLIGNNLRILANCMKSGTTVESIEFSWLKRFRVSVPEIEEQTAIASILTDMDTEISALEAKRSKARQIKQGMMQNLLTGKIRLV
jgi:type I restriction enzyme S subunit